MKYEGRPGRDIPDFFARHFNLAVSEDLVDDEVKRVRAKNQRKNRRWAADGPDSVAIWTDWLRVDEGRLGVRKVLIQVRNEGYEVHGLVDALRSMPGIRQVIETKTLREIFAVALLRTEEEEEDLRARVLEHAGGRPVSVHVILSESHEPTARTWLSLAKAELSALESD